MHSLECIPKIEDPNTALVGCLTAYSKGKFSKPTITQPRGMRHQDSRH